LEGIAFQSNAVEPMTGACSARANAPGAAAAAIEATNMSLRVIIFSLSAGNRHLAKTGLNLQQVAFAHA
jgi:hypothetical protein